MINLTDSAKQYLINALDNNNASNVMLSVNGGGCGGFQYSWDFVEQYGEFDSIVELENDKNLIIDSMSEMLVIGAEIDYINNLGGAYLQVSNPLASSTCGCGTSFNVDDSVWEKNDQDRLEG